MAVTVTTEYSDWDTRGRPLKAHITTTPAGRAPSEGRIGVARATQASSTPRCTYRIVLLRSPHVCPMNAFTGRLLLDRSEMQ
jgi:hypothetical protein